MTATFVRRLLAVAACVVAVSGCAINQDLRMPTERDVARRAARHLEIIRAQPDVPVAPLSFHDAVVRALAFNLDLRVAALEARIARGDIDLANLEKLPDVVLAAGYTRRDRPTGFSSDTAPEQLTKITRSAELSWNILDFGIAYIQSLQARDAYAARREAQRRMANQIINEVRSAYWTVVLARDRLEKSRRIQRDIEGSLKLAERLAEKRLQDPLVSLNYRDGLLDLRRQLRAYELELEAAETRLARLLNLPPRQHVALLPATPDPAYEVFLEYDREALEEAALMLRSELREADFTLRSRRLDVVRSYVQMVPSLRLRWGTQYDNLNTLRENSWSEYGFDTSLSLLNLVNMLMRAGQARREVALSELRRLSISLAVMEQVGASQARIDALDEDYRLAHESATVRREIYEKRMNRLATDVGDDLERARAAVATLSAELREDRAYAALQAAYGSLLAAVGVDQFPETVDLGDPPEAARQIERHQQALLPQVRLALAKVSVLGRRGDASGGKQTPETR